MNGLEMEFSVVFISLGCGFDYRSVFSKDLLLFFSFGLPKISRFSFAMVSKICLSGSENQFMFSSKRVVLCVLSFFLFGPYLSLGCSFFFGINLFGKLMSWDTMDTVGLETAGH